MTTIALADDLVVPGRQALVEWVNELLQWRPGDDAVRRWGAFLLSAGQVAPPEAIAQALGYRDARSLRYLKEALAQVGMALFPAGERTGRPAVSTRPEVERAVGGVLLEGALETGCLPKDDGVFLLVPLLVTASLWRRRPAADAGAVCGDGCARVADRGVWGSLRSGPALPSGRRRGCGVLSVDGAAAAAVAGDLSGRAEGDPGGPYSGLLSGHGPGRGASPWSEGTTLPRGRARVPRWTKLVDLPKTQLHTVRQPVKADPLFFVYPLDRERNVALQQEEEGVQVYVPAACSANNVAQWEQWGEEDFAKEPFVLDRERGLPEGEQKRYRYAETRTTLVVEGDPDETLPLRTLLLKDPAGEKPGERYPFVWLTTEEESGGRELLNG